MSVIAVASRYAKSLIGLAQDQNVLSDVVQDIKLFDEAVSNRDLYLLVKSPIIKADKKQKIFQALFKDKVSQLTYAFFEIVIRKRREAFLPEISHEFIKQYKVIKNITTASLTTAIGISEQTVAIFEKELKSSLDITGDLELITRENPDIIGGFIVEVEDNLYDASVRRKLAGLKKEILDNSYIKSL